MVVLRGDTITVSGWEMQWISPKLIPLIEVLFHDSFRAFQYNQKIKRRPLFSMMKIYMNYTPKNACF